jgi:hypothetical protein
MRADRHVTRHVRLLKLSRLGHVPRSRGITTPDAWTNGPGETRTYIEEPWFVDRLIRERDPGVMATLFGPREIVDWDAFSFGNRLGARGAPICYSIVDDPERLGRRITWEAAQGGSADAWRIRYPELCSTAIRTSP